MTPAEKGAAARALLDMPLFHLLMDDMETAAINRCVTAAPTDHETRAAYAAETRAIRNFRSKLNLLTEEAKVTGNGAPA